MIRKLLLPAVLVGLLGGCVTAGYGYHDGYYGQPGVEYRYRGYGSYPYGYGYYPYGGYGYYPGRSYYYPYYGYPYYPYYYDRGGNHSHHHHDPQPPVSGPSPTNPPPGNDDNDNPPPWRDFNRRRRTTEGTAVALPTQSTNPSGPQPVIRQTPRPEARAEGSRMQQAVQRAKETRRRESGEAQER